MLDKKFKRNKRLWETHFSRNSHVCFIFSVLFLFSRNTVTSLNLIPLNLINKKNAFQWDAYHPLVARISQHALLPGGVPAQGGVPAMGVYLAGGSTWPGGCTCPGGLPAQVLPPYEQND